MNNKDMTDKIEVEQVAWATRLYNTAYHAGHHDTVEGGYTHVYPQDMDRYHEDIVQEWLADHPQPAVQGEPVAVINGSHCFSLDDANRLMRLPTGTKLYTAPRPAPDVAALVKALERAVNRLENAGLFSSEAAIRGRAALAAHRKGDQQ